MTLQVELVSPERILYSGEADMVIARTVGGGELAFLTGHAPFVGALEIATVTLRTPEGDQLVAVHGGFVEVSNDTVTILSDVAELADQIDVDRARAAQERAEQHAAADHDAEADAAVKRAHVRLAAAGGFAAAH
ncbi:MAG TPA: ATP synthase F1 subunit epsilon [Acidimicrobiales bacterium]|jgi:F-type H+-transporting ATPase subunit epsilon|nr:ATP synthase F1 subunit epsilon [Acidimicrobiales bacterium]